MSISLYPPPGFLISLTRDDSKELVTARLISEARVAETNGREFSCGTRHCTQWALMGCALAVGLTLGGNQKGQKGIRSCPDPKGEDNWGRAGVNKHALNK